MATKANDTLEKAKKVLEKHRDKIRSKYSVKQMGVGYKIEGGKITDKIAIIFYVDKKISQDELVSKGLTSIPKEIEGIPTDVVEIPGGFKLRKNVENK